MANRTGNRSYYTDGLDNPTQDWLQKHIRVTDKPQWGTGRVLRWYPAHGGKPPSLRVMMEGTPAPQVVLVTDVEVL